MLAADNPSDRITLFPPQLTARNQPPRSHPETIYDRHSIDFFASVVYTFGCKLCPTVGTDNSVKNGC